MNWLRLLCDFLRARYFPHLPRGVDQDQRDPQRKQRVASLPYIAFDTMCSTPGRVQQCRYPNVLDYKSNILMYVLFYGRGGKFRENPE